VSEPTAAERRIHATLLARLAGLGFVLPGSLVQRRMRCGSPGCHCRQEPPTLHGPYQQWTRTERGKTVTRLLSPDALERYQPWLDDERVLQETITELHQLSIAVVERGRSTRAGRNSR
jgi:hypothetical protein